MLSPAYIPGIIIMLKTLSKAWIGLVMSGLLISLGMDIYNNPEILGTILTTSAIFSLAVVCCLK